VCSFPQQTKVEVQKSISRNVEKRYLKKTCMYNNTALFYYTINK